MSFFSDLKTTLKNKKAGFYLALAAALMAVIGAIIYATTYTQTEYYSFWVLFFPIIGAVLFVLLSIFSVTEDFSSVAVTACCFAGFLLLIKAVYIIFSEVFFGGINKEAFASMDPRFAAVILLYLFATIISNVALYLKHSKKSKGDTENENA